jgi:hypothetical protein
MFHGDAFWFNQNDFFSAYTWFNNRNGIRKPMPRRWLHLAVPFERIRLSSSATTRAGDSITSQPLTR